MRPIKVYALREKGTDKFMPARQPSKARGFSNDEPIKDGGYWGPRLFKSKQSAINALTAWTKGSWRMVYEHDEWGNIDCAYPDPNKYEYRRRDKMEIVEFDLNEVKDPSTQATSGAAQAEAAST